MGLTWAEAWERELDRLELDVDTAERMLREGGPVVTPEWTPPQLEGALPEEMVFRAQTILQRQQVVLAAFTQSLAATRDQHELTRKIRDSVPAANERPVYVDVSV